MKLLIISQGSQSIQLIRELYSIGYAPIDLTVLSTVGSENNSFLEFLKYYKIEKYLIDKDSIDKKIIELSNKNEYDLLVSFSNPFVLSDKILKLFLKSINFHPGILPNYKGSLSTVYSLKNNEPFVGGTWHYMQKLVDSGNIIESFTLQILSYDNAFTLHHKIFKNGIQCLESVLQKVIVDYPGIRQSNSGKFYYNKFPDISHLDEETQKKINYFPPLFE